MFFSANDFIKEVFGNVPSGENIERLLKLIGEGEDIMRAKAEKTHYLEDDTYFINLVNAAERLQQFLDKNIDAILDDIIKSMPPAEDKAKIRAFITGMRSYLKRRAYTFKRTIQLSNLILLKNQPNIEAPKVSAKNGDPEPLDRKPNTGLGYGAGSPIRITTGHIETITIFNAISSSA